MGVISEEFSLWEKSLGEFLRGSYLRLPFSAFIAAAAAAEFICHEKNIHVYINVKDRWAARKE